VYVFPSKSIKSVMCSFKRTMDKQVRKKHMRNAIYNPKPKKIETEHVRPMDRSLRGSKRGSKNCVGSRAKPAREA
jgi:hypothetical protein